MVHIFIVNAKLVKQDYAEKLREKLSEIEGLEYYVFATNSAGHEGILTQTIIRTFDTDKIRIYSVGGSGTIHNIINNVDDLDNVEIAWVPTFECKFLDSICEDSSKFYDISRLINGKARSVDLLKANDTYILNAFSIGIDSDLLDFAYKSRELGFFSSKIPYTLGLIHSIAISKNYSYEIEVDNDVFSGKATEVFIGNGKILGNGLHFGLNADITDGIASYRIIEDTKLRRRLTLVKALMADDRTTLDAQSKYGMSKTMKIKRSEGCPFLVNVDGELIESEFFEVSVVPGKLKLVCPEGVEL